MGTLLKYLFYVLIIAAIYFIGVGFYQGKLTKDSTLGEMTNHVTTNTKQVIENGYNTTKDAVQGGIDEITQEGQEVIQNGEEAIETDTEEVVNEINK